MKTKRCSECNGLGTVDIIDRSRINSTTIDIPYKSVICEVCEGEGKVEVPYYTCPQCGLEFDPKDAEIDFPDVFLECDCGYELSADFGDDIREDYIVKLNERLEGER